MLCSKVKNKEDLEDLVQTTMLNVLSHQEEILAEKSADYVAVAAYHALHNYYREKAEKGENFEEAYAAISFSTETSDLAGAQSVARWVVRHYKTGSNIGCRTVAESLVRTVRHFWSRYTMVEILLGWSDCYSWSSARYTGESQSQLMLKRILVSMPKVWQERLLKEGEWDSRQRRQIEEFFATEMPNTESWRKKIMASLPKETYK